jgi:hypothetical protein
MENSILKKFEGKTCRIVLNNGFRYNFIQFTFDSENGFLEFKDRTGQKVLIHSSFVAVLTEVPLE